MKKLLILYWVLTTTLITLTIMYLNNGISLNGYWSDKTLFVFWLVLTVIVITKNFRKRWTKTFLTGLIIIIILSMLPMMIPFINIITFATANDREFNYKINSKLRLEESFMSAIVPPRVILIKSLGPLEKVIGYTDYQFFLNRPTGDTIDFEQAFRLKDVKSVELLGNNQTSNKLRFVFEQGSTIREFQK